MSGCSIKVGKASWIWFSKQQRNVTSPTCESKYHGMTMAPIETLWKGRVLREAGFSVDGMTLIKSDNQGAIDFVDAQ